MKTRLIRYRQDGVSMRFGLWNHGLSLKAMGCLYLLLSLARLENWEFSVQGLVALARAKGMDDGRHSIRTALAELEAQRFLVRQRLRGDDGQLNHTCWLVHDEPMPEQDLHPEQAIVDWPSTENPASENPIQEGWPIGGSAVDGKPCVGELVSENRPQHREITTNPLNRVTNVTLLPQGGKTNPASASAARDGFAGQAMALWNSQAPEHWVRIRELGQQRQRKLNGLVREFGSPAKALAALEASLQQAHAEEWCMKASARLSLENWLSNGKVRQYQEKAAVAQQATSAALSGEQQEIAALAAQHPELIDGVLLEDGVLRLRYSERVQQQVGYPAMGMVNTVGALAAEIRYLRERLAPPCPF